MRFGGAGLPDPQCRRGRCRDGRFVLSDAESNEQPKALACYGVYFPERAAARDPAGESDGDMLLRFVEDRPVSGAAATFLEWVLRRLDERDVRVWALIWDQAFWHTSGAVRSWIAQHNKRVKREGGVRILACELPSKSPWAEPD